ncbi:MAG TPA: TIGR02680 family protein [Actinophytocola sp.]|uniref:TIGR02680 family protein n=1 Tax=Actinophytocola sp. TaxID=1872138 RepID=UPI002DDCE1E6|nr:TIGR02680 family protein [Actinophytocola sp.]HEV2782669.1 TIGR02680 family protein [Actinophytocola sp.]
MTRRLPQPGRGRWQPLRAGLVDLFYYDAEEFWFRDGRLLLRGNNGTGKSKVLALTLPFLLDGDLSPHRVEPDADPKKRMEWNLLLAGAHPHPERLGYTWLEFGRLADDGQAEFRTLGCGLKAVSGKGIARHWFFLTDQRVGPELELVDATGTALTRDRLDEALGGRGTVYDKARAYRRAVDEALFGLGEQRYGALVDLLIQLRQPQLSKRPSEKALSDALTEALPPLDQAVIADVAEAFRSLEEDRDELAVMRQASEAARSFLGHYRRYARIAARRRAERPRRAQSAYEKVNAELNAANAAHEAAETALRAAEQRLSELDSERDRLRARDEELRKSPEMRDARALHEAAETAKRLAAEAARADVDRAKAQQVVLSRQEKRRAAADRLAGAERSAGTARVSTMDTARAAGVGDEHRDRIDSRLDPADADVVAVLRLDAGEITDRRGRAIQHVSGLIDADEQARRQVAEARQRVEELAAQVAELADRRAAAAQSVVDRGREHVATTREHLAGATELRVPDLAGTVAALELWVETLDGVNPGRAAADTAGRAAAEALARTEAGLDQRDSAARARVTQLAEEITRLEAGEDTAPPPAHTRDVAARAGRDGAPLWQLVDFVEDLPAEDRAGLEAALEAAGILDAWLNPDGVLLAPGTDDVVLLPGRPVPHHLGTVLRPAVDRDDPRAAAVADNVVSAVLGSIGLGAGNGDTWVTTGGRFRLGILDGAWRKATARYIGAGAREAARRARLAELRAELSIVESEFAAIAGERDLLAERRDRLAGELGGMPDDARLREAHADVRALATEARRLGQRVDAAQDALARLTNEAESARQALTSAAAELDLPADRQGLGRVREALTDYRTALAELWPVLRALAEARRADAEAAEELAGAEDELRERAERAAEAEAAAEIAAERHSTLEATVGAAVAELERRLAEVAKSLAVNRNAAKVADEQRIGAVNDRGKAEGRREELAGQLVLATGERAEAAESLRRFAATGLLSVALPELDVPDPQAEWAPNPTVLLARQIDQRLADSAADDQAWERVQRRVTDELKSLTDALSSQGNIASAQLLEDGIVVEVIFRGRPASVPELAAALEVEVAERGRLLAERERVILENHLVNEVASTLQELISDAEAQVALMNSELAERPTSTGMKLRLLWRPREDGPAGLAEARERLLRQTADAWSPEDRAAVGGFLQARIAEVRSRNVAGTWLEHLSEALDYRSWNRFVIQRQQNGQWRSATGPASGGERVLAASVPLFAAASAHYASAGNPHAPRLVTLDEAFAGVDDNARAKFLGLLASFDLDVVMTSEREWGCYPEVPGLAIAQLSRTDDVAAVLVTNWEWDGTRRSKVDRVPALLGAPRPEPVESPEGLWSDNRAE